MPAPARSTRLRSGMFPSRFLILISQIFVVEVLEVLEMLEDVLDSCSESQLWPSAVLAVILSLGQHRHMVGGLESPLDLAENLPVVSI